MGIKAQAQVEITSVKDIKDAAEAAKNTAASSKITADNTAKHFWADSEGAHVSQTAKYESQQGGNTVIKTDGISIRKGTDELAKFTADGAQIGKNGNNARMVIGATKLSMSDANQVECFKVEMPERNANSTEVRFSIGDDYRKKVGERLSTKGPFIWKCELPYMPTKVTSSFYTVGQLNTIVFITQDTSQNVYYTIDENELTVNVKSTYTGGSISDIIFKFDVGATLYTTILGSYPASGADDYMALVIGNGKSGENCDALTVDWNGKITANDGIYAGGNSHVEGNLTTRGLVNNMQAGRVDLKASGTTKTVSGTKYYELRGKVKFANAFDNTPMIALTPISGVGFRLLPPTADDMSRTGFTAIMYRNNDTITSVMWMAMEATQ